MITRSYFTIAIISVSFVLWAAPAHAYLDPGTGSLIVQSIIGSIAGGLAVIGIYWRKIKNFFSAKKTANNTSNDSNENQ